MKKTGLIVIVSFCAALSVAAFAADDEILGTWIVTQAERGRERVYTLTITESGGAWVGERGSSALSELRIENGGVRFTRPVSRGGRSDLMAYRASVVDGRLVGTASSEQGETNFVAIRMPESERLAIASRSEAIALLEPCRILAVFAHPDDETFAMGTFAKLSAAGECVQLVYTTSGDAGGDRTGRGLSGADLAGERESEMRLAAEALGIPRSPLFLRYPDGFVYENWNDVLGNVGSILEETRPEVVVTFGPDGYYGHADHRAIGQITERAFDESGIASHLLHVALSRSTNDIIVKAGGGDRYKPVDDRFITYTVDVRKHLKQRVEAMKAHRTQFDDGTVVQFQLLGSLTGREEYVEVRYAGEPGALSSLFSR